MLTTFKKFLNNQTLIYMPRMAFGKGGPGGPPGSDAPPPKKYQRKLKPEKKTWFKEEEYKDGEYFFKYTHEEQLKEYGVKTEEDKKRAMKEIEKAKKAEREAQEPFFEAWNKKQSAIDELHRIMEEEEETGVEIQERPHVDKRNTLDPLETFDFPEKFFLRKPIATDVKQRLAEKVKARQIPIVLDKDGFRVDCGLLISRDPIFYHMEDKEMELAKKEHKLKKKHGFYYAWPKEFFDFSDQMSTEGYFRNDPENAATHHIYDKDGNRTTYSSNSKLFDETPLNVEDPHSIQFAPVNRTYFLVRDLFSDRWVFPQGPLRPKYGFKDNKLLLFNSFNNDSWRIHYDDFFPDYIEERELTPMERENPSNRKAIGVRTYFFSAKHIRGKVTVNDEKYQDFHWVTKRHLNKYVHENYYNQFINILEDK